MTSFENVLAKLSPADKAWVGNIGPRKYNWTIEDIVKAVRHKAGEEVDPASVARYLQTKGFARSINYSEPVDSAEQTVLEEAITTSFGLERDLQSALRANLDQLERGLRVSDGGKERTVESGRIDITAEDDEGRTVVIELKVGQADLDAVGQVMAYMGDLTVAETPVRGILVAAGFTPRALSAASLVPNLELKKYAFRFTFSAADLN